MSAPENPPAFPACNEANVNGTMGMTLRDWFAGRAMQAFVHAHMALDSRNYIDGTSAGSVAEEAFMLADAMLAARTPHSTEER